MRCSQEDQLVGVLLGTALGDALGLPCEGMSPRAIARRFGVVDRFRLLGGLGIVSDDTEQSALIAQSLARHPDDVGRCVRDFQRSLLGWFCRLPWGVGRATVLSCLRMAIGLEPTGVRSAGNGAAMRSAIVGVFHRDRPDRRRELTRALAEVTHRDARAVEGAVFVAEMAALAAGAPDHDSRVEVLLQACRAIDEPELSTAIQRAVAMADDGRTTQDAARSCGTSGYVVHTLAFASFCFARYGDRPMRAFSEAIGAGGDTDSVAAILGAWLGALHGIEGLDATLLGRIQDGPFGCSHLKALGECIAARIEGRVVPTPTYSAAFALVRNLILYPVILSHGLRRLVPI